MVSGKEGQQRRNTVPASSGVGVPAAALLSSCLLNAKSAMSIVDCNVYVKVCFQRMIVVMLALMLVRYIASRFGYSRASLCVRIYLCNLSGVGSCLSNRT